MEHFELGKSFTVRSDHRALKWLRSFKDKMGQDSRWLERLAEFEFAINRPSTRQTSQKRLRVISFPMDGRRSAGEACGSDDIVPGYHDGNVLDTGSSTWLNR